MPAKGWGIIFVAMRRRRAVESQTRTRAEAMYGVAPGSSVPSRRRECGDWFSMASAVPRSPPHPTEAKDLHSCAGPLDRPD